MRLIEYFIKPVQHKKIPPHQQQGRTSLFSSCWYYQPLSGLCCVLCDGFCAIAKTPTNELKGPNYCIIKKELRKEFPIVLLLVSLPGCYACKQHQQRRDAFFGRPTAAKTPTTACCFCGTPAGCGKVRDPANK